MSRYPISVITKDRKGNEEVRLLVEKGQYVRYQYMDPETGEIIEKGKESIILRNREGVQEHLYIIPLQPNRSLVIRPKDEKKDRMVWNASTETVERPFD